MNLLSTKGEPVPAQKLPLPVAQFLQSIKIDIKVNSRNTRNRVILMIVILTRYHALLVSLPMILHFLVDSLVGNYSPQRSNTHSVHMGILYMIKMVSQNQ